MNRAEFVERVAREADVAKQDADAAVGAVFAAIAEALARGEGVTVVGFGKFSRKSLPARQRRNPRTGEPVALGPSNAVSFRAGKTLKDALN